MGACNILGSLIDLGNIVLQEQVTEKPYTSLKVEEFFMEDGFSSIKISPRFSDDVAKRRIEF